MTYTINDSYTYGSRDIAPESVQALAERIAERIDAERCGYGYAEYRLCAEWQGAHYARWSLTLISAHTGIGAESLDYSNAQAIETEAPGGIVELYAGGMETRLYVELTDDTEALLFPIEPSEADAEESAEGWTQIQSAAELAYRIAEYPALDDDDYYAREHDALLESYDTETHYLGLSESVKGDIAETVLSVSDYENGVRVEDITRALIDHGHSPRRVVCVNPNERWTRYAHIQGVVIDEYGDATLQPLARV